MSSATNLVPGDTNASLDIFLRDRLAGETRRVNVTSLGKQANVSRSPSVSLSANGRFVAFASESTNLVVGDTNEAADIFVHDTLTRTTERVSVASNEAQTEQEKASSHPSISADGRFVAFVSGAENLVSRDKNGNLDIFLRDRETGTTERISVDASGPELRIAARTTVSVDGRFVAYLFELPSLEFPGHERIEYYLRDRQTGITERIDVRSAGQPALCLGPPNVCGDGGQYSTPSISADGRFVTFASNATNLSRRQSEEMDVVYVRDRIADTTLRVYPANNRRNQYYRKVSYDPVISADGRFVAFWSKDQGILPVGTFGELYIRDLSIFPEGKNDLVVDFGTRGLWLRLNDSTWSKIDNASPGLIAAGDLDRNFEDEVIATFPGRGLVARYNVSARWRQLHSASPLRLVVGDFDGNGNDGLAADFGAQGLWVRVNEGDWRKVHASSSAGLRVGDLNGDGADEIVANFGKAGIWARFGSRWIQLGPYSPVRVSVGDLDGHGLDDVVIEITSGLAARYNNKSPFVGLANVNTQGLAIGDLDGNVKQDLLVDFGNAGLRVLYNNRAPWIRLDPRSPTSMLATDLDSDGKEDVVADFGSDGVWARYEDAGAFRRLHSWPSQAIAAGGFD